MSPEKLKFFNMDISLIAVELKLVPPEILTLYFQDSEKKEIILSGLTEDIFTDSMIESNMKAVE